MSLTLQQPVHRRRSRPPRRRRQAVLGAVVVTYLAAAVVAAAARQLLPMPYWLALHLLLLGAATNAIVVYGAHFSEGLLHARPARRWFDAAVAALNVGVVGVLVGVTTAHPVLVGAGAAVVGGVVTAHAVRLTSMALRRTSARLRAAVWFYVASAAALGAGAVAGALLGTGSAHSERWHDALHAFHVHANILGWVGLAVIGTLFILWPTALRTRMVDDAPQVARRVLAVCVAGLATALGGLLAALPLLAAGGAAAFAAGVLLSLDPFVRTARQRPPHEASTWMLAAATAWFTVALGLDVAGLATGGAESSLDHVVPLLAVGLVGQALAGALTFLLPVVVGGGPAGNRRMHAVLHVAWVPRILLANAGIVLLALPAGGAWRTAGWVMAVSGLGSFVPLAAGALARGSSS